MTSADLHQALARYRVYISRWKDHRRGRDDSEIVAEGLTWPAAQELREQVNQRLAAEEPHLENCMSRSIAGIQLTNREEVAKILGYGPNFNHERAEAAVFALLAAQGTPDASALPQQVLPDGGETAVDEAASSCMEAA